MYNFGIPYDKIVQNILHEVVPKASYFTLRKKIIDTHLHAINTIIYKTSNSKKSDIQCF